MTGSLPPTTATPRTVLNGTVHICSSVVRARPRLPRTPPGRLDRISLSSEPGARTTAPGQGLPTQRPMITAAFVRPPVPVRADLRRVGPSFRCRSRNGFDRSFDIGVVGALVANRSAGAHPEPGVAASHPAPCARARVVTAAVRASGSPFSAWNLTQALVDLGHDEHFGIELRSDADRCEAARQQCSTLAAKRSAPSARNASHHGLETGSPDPGEACPESHSRGSADQPNQSSP